MRDPGWRARSGAAIRSLLTAANNLRVEPVPEALAVIDRTLGRAQEEAQMATDGYLAALEDVNTAALLAAV